MFDILIWLGSNDILLLSISYVNCCRGLIYVTSQVKCHLDAFFNIILSMLLCVCPHDTVALTKEV